MKSAFLDGSHDLVFAEIYSRMIGQSNFAYLLFYHYPYLHHQLSAWIKHLRMSHRLKRPNQSNIRILLPCCLGCKSIIKRLVPYHYPLASGLKKQLRKNGVSALQ